MTLSSPLLSVENITLDYRGNAGWVRAVDDVSFTVARGETFGLAGESGCGKSSIAHLLLGHRRGAARIVGGRIHFDGQDILTLSGSALQQLRGARVALVPQNPATALSPAMRVGRQIEEVLLAKRRAVRADEASRQSTALLEHVALPDPARLARRYPHELSGGQQQRVVIAMALACAPDLVVLDEPTTGLDVTTQAEILKLLARLQSERGISMLYITHDLRVLSSIAHRVGVMYAGRLVEVGPVRRQFREPRHPYTRGLIAAMPDGPFRGRGLRGLFDRATLAPGCRFAPRCDSAVQACLTIRPPYEEVEPGHEVACLRWRDLDAGGEDMPAIAADPGPRDVKAVALLEVEDVALAYRSSGPPWARQPIPVVRDVSMSIAPAEIVALVGESGSGKSTVARAIAGLIAPIAGRLRFDGLALDGSYRKRSPEIRRAIQLIFQNPDASLNPRARIGAIIERPLRLFFGLEGGASARRVRELLEQVKLDHSYADRYPDQLSGGERQRVAIARALAAEPRMLVCDEVVSALDASVQAGIVDLLAELAERSSLGVLFISHDLAVVRRLAHRAVVLYRGRVVETGPTDRVLSAPKDPYTQHLVDSSPKFEAACPPGGAP